MLLKATHVRWCLGAWALFGIPLSLSAQLPPPKRELPRAPAPSCVVEGSNGAVAEVSADKREEAARLATSATQAAIVGDHAAARDLLTRAAVVDPTGANIAYLLARSLEELGDGEGALAEYCRYLALAPTAPDAEDVRERIDVLAPEPGLAVSEEAAQHFRNGVAQYDLGRLPQAERAFDEVIRTAPEWPEAYYNRGLVRSREGDTESARADLERYLALSPDAPDREAVAGLVDLLATPVRQYSPGVAAFTSVLLPGSGHFYTGRAGRGFLLLTAVGGAVATGVLKKDTEVRCLGPVVNGSCPPEQVLESTTTRPLLVPAIAVAGALALVGAIDAYRGAARAGRSGVALVALDRGGSGSKLVVSAPIPSGGFDGRVGLELLRIRF